MYEGFSFIFEKRLHWISKFKCTYLAWLRRKAVSVDETTSQASSAAIDALVEIHKHSFTCMSIEDFLKRAQFTRVLLDVVLWFQCLHESIDLAKSHVAVSELKGEVRTIVRLNVRFDALLFNVYDDSSHCFLHHELSEHVCQVDALALLDFAKELVKKAERLELFDKSIPLVCVQHCCSLLGPIIKFFLNFFLILLLLIWLLKLKAAGKGRDFYAKVDIVCKFTTSGALNLIESTKGAEETLNLNCNLAGYRFSFFHGMSGEDDSTVSTFVPNCLPHSSARRRIDTRRSFINEHDLWLPNHRQRKR